MGDAQANQLQALGTGLTQRQVNENLPLIHLRVHFQIQLPEVGHAVLDLDRFTGFEPTSWCTPQ